MTRGVLTAPATCSNCFYQGLSLLRVAEVPSGSGKSTRNQKLWKAQPYFVELWGGKVERMRIGIRWAR